MDAVSRERVRQAAQEIRQATGLYVDVAYGASGTPVTVRLPSAATAGRR